MQMDRILFLGVDAGGTRSRSRLVDRDGHVLGEGEAGPGNLTIGIEKACAAILSATGSAFAAANLEPAAMAVTHAGLGIAGAIDPDLAATMARRHFPFASVTIRDDVEIACLGAHGGRDGGVLVLGTGSQGIVKVQDVFHRVSGWGFALSDWGSGAGVGHMALRRALLAHQEVIPHSPMTRELMSVFDDNPSRMLRWAMQAGPGDWGEHAPVAFAHARKGDPVATDIVVLAVRDVALLLDRMTDLGARRIALTGGLAREYKGRLPRRFDAIIVEAEHDELAGAVELARLAFAQRGQ